MALLYMYSAWFTDQPTFKMKTTGKTYNQNAFFKKYITNGKKHFDKTDNSREFYMTKTEKQYMCHYKSYFRFIRFIKTKKKAKTFLSPTVPNQILRQKIFCAMHYIYSFISIYN